VSPAGPQDSFFCGGRGCTAFPGKYAPSRDLANEMYADGTKASPMEAGFYLRASAPVEHVVLAGDLARNLRRRASRRLSRLAYCAPQKNPPG
jgi:hypothetical protein